MNSRGEHLFKGLVLEAIHKTGSLAMWMGMGITDLVGGSQGWNPKILSEKMPPMRKRQFTELTGADNPFDSIDVGEIAAAGT